MTPRLTLTLLAALLTLGTTALPARAHDHAAMQRMQAEAANAALPGDSLHRITAPLTDQTGRRFKLADEHGPATLVSMFYGDCQIACPIIIENAKRTLEAVPVAQRDGLRILLVSLNPGVDTSASLAKLARLHALPDKNVRLAVSDNETHTREVAAALGIKYRRAANGEINHSTRFLLLDAQGRAVASSDTLGVEPDPKLLDGMAGLLRAAPATAPHAHGAM